MAPSPCGWMKTTTPSSSALAQNGWNFGSLISSPATLPPMAAPRRPYFLTPSSSCSAARSGCCSATVAKATNRSGLAAHASASFSFWILMICLARSRSVLYQLGLMLSASTSMPCSSMACSRTATCDGHVEVRPQRRPCELQVHQRQRLGHRAVGVHVDRLHALAVDDDLPAPRLGPRRRGRHQVAADEHQAARAPRPWSGEIPCDWSWAPSVDFC